MSDTQREIKETLEKATPGPWKISLRFKDLITEDGKVLVREVGNGYNAKLIANAPKWLLYQQELIEQLQQGFDDVEMRAMDAISERNDLQLLIEQKDAEIAQLREQLEHSKLTPMQKMSRSMDILSQMKGANT